MHYPLGNLRKIPIMHNYQILKTILFCTMILSMSCLTTEPGDVAGPSGQPENPPVLLTPEDSAIGLDTSITFFWSHVEANGFENGTRYHLNLYNLTDSIWQYYLVVTDSILKIDGLKYGKTYKWDIMAEWLWGKYGYMVHVSSAKYFVFSKRNNN